MRLFQTSAFGGLLQDAARYLAPRFESARGPSRLSAHAIEKDYYLTEMLRLTSRNIGAPAIFKGGTSLTKGWGLSDRFSEDVDLFIDPLAFDPPLGGKAMRTCMRGLIAAITGELPLRKRSMPTRARRGIARTEHLSYESVLPGLAPIPTEICLAAGIGSGREPTETVALRSYLSEYIVATGVDIASADIAPFHMRLLHFRRTFVEKLFAIDHAVATTGAAGLPLGPYARHYFDLCSLSRRPEVIAMLQGPEYRAIVRDCIEIDRRFYRRAGRDPEAWSFRACRALFPEAALSAALRQDYERQCEMLCYGEYPPWREVLARFEALREWL